MTTGRINQVTTVPRRGAGRKPPPLRPRDRGGSDPPQGPAASLFLTPPRTTLANPPTTPTSAGPPHAPSSEDACGRPGSTARALAGRTATDTDATCARTTARATVQPETTSSLEAWGRGAATPDLGGGAPPASHARTRSDGRDGPSQTASTKQNCNSPAKRPAENRLARNCSLSCHLLIVVKQADSASSAYGCIQIPAAMYFRLKIF